MQEERKGGEVAGQTVGQQREGQYALFSRCSFAFCEREVLGGGRTFAARVRQGGALFLSFFSGLSAPQWRLPPEATAASFLDEAGAARPRSSRKKDGSKQAKSRAPKQEIDEERQESRELGAGSRGRGRGRERRKKREEKKRHLCFSSLNRLQQSRMPLGRVDLRPGGFCRGGHVEYAKKREKERE